MAQRILIVDDDTLLRDLYEEVLTSEGFEVTVAKDGEEGLAQLIEGGFDATLLDVMMPKLDGIGVLKKLKVQTPKKPNGPIILLTSLDHDPELAHASELGAVTHLLKADILPPLLIQKIREVLPHPNDSSQPGQ